MHKSFVTHLNNYNNVFETKYNNFNTIMTSPMKLIILHYIKFL